MTSPLKPWLVLGVIFLAGIATGCALTVVFLPHFLGPPGQAQMRGHFMTFLTRRLELTADQQAKIEPIVDDTAQKIEALHRDEVDRVGQIIRDADEKMAALLTPEQKAKLQTMQAEREKMFSGHLRPWGAPREDRGPGPMHPFGGPDAPGAPGNGDMPPPPPPDDQKPGGPSGPPPPNP